MIFYYYGGSLHDICTQNFSLVRMPDLTVNFVLEIVLIMQLSSCYSTIMII
jgi:hypothetical protein